MPSDAPQPQSQTSSEPPAVENLEVLQPSGLNWLSPKFLTPLGAQPIAAHDPLLFSPDGMADYSPPDVPFRDPAFFPDTRPASARNYGMTLQRRTDPAMETLALDAGEPMLQPRMSEAVDDFSELLSESGAPSLPIATPSTSATAAAEMQSEPATQESAALPSAIAYPAPPSATPPVASLSTNIVVPAAPAVSSLQRRVDPLPPVPPASLPTIQLRQDTPPTPPNPTPTTATGIVPGEPAVTEIASLNESIPAFEPSSSETAATTPAIAAPLNLGSEAQSSTPTHPTIQLQPETVASSPTFSRSDRLPPTSFSRAPELTAATPTDLAQPTTDQSASEPSTSPSMLQTQRDRTASAEPVQVEPVQVEPASLQLKPAPASKPLPESADLPATQGLAEAASPNDLDSAAPATQMPLTIQPKLATSPVEAAQLDAVAPTAVQPVAATEAIAPTEATFTTGSEALTASAPELPAIAPLLNSPTAQPTPAAATISIQAKTVEPAGSDSGVTPADPIASAAANISQSAFTPTISLAPGIESGSTTAESVDEIVTVPDETGIPASDAIAPPLATVPSDILPRQSAIAAESDLTTESEVSPPTPSLADISTQSHPLTTAISTAATEPTAQMTTSTPTLSFQPKLEAITANDSDSAIAQPAATIVTNTPSLQPRLEPATAAEPDVVTNQLAATIAELESVETLTPDVEASNFVETSAIAPPALQTRLQPAVVPVAETTHSAQSDLLQTELANEVEATPSTDAPIDDLGNQLAQEHLAPQIQTRLSEAAEPATPTPPLTQPLTIGESATPSSAETTSPQPQPDAFRDIPLLRSLSLDRPPTLKPSRPSIARKVTEADEVLAGIETDAFVDNFTDADLADDHVVDHIAGADPATETVVQAKVETPIAPLVSPAEPTTVAQRRAEPDTASPSEPETAAIAPPPMAQQVPDAWSSIEDLLSQTTPTQVTPNETTPSVQRLMNPAVTPNLRPINIPTATATPTIPPLSPPTPAGEASSSSASTSASALAESATPAALTAASTATPTSVESLAPDAESPTPAALTAASASTAPPIPAESLANATESVTPAALTAASASTTPTTSTAETSSPAAESPVISETSGNQPNAQEESDSLEHLAREIYHLLRQRIEIERERGGRYYRDRFI